MTKADDRTLLIEAVRDIAVPADANVVVGRAYTDADFEETVAGLDFDGQPSPDDVARRSESVREITTALEAVDVPVEARGVVGEIGPEFVSLADTADADLLFIQGQSRSPTGKALFGSTAQTVILNATCPVTFVSE
ncbi:universal stress protein [Natrinema sp. SYSU A 869]|uniref:universal stress protein n=1 Tax=Natrinema sp. SYSU A 869 TaxID=2871694 RepID=UPI0021033E24|nr:universal stress protein [Natrinema sp. SYSU A 869]